MGAFEDFVVLELPRRAAFLTVAITGYDGDPNEVVAPPPSWMALQSGPSTNS